MIRCAWRFAGGWVVAGGFAGMWSRWLRGWVGSERVEWARCWQSPGYFLDQYGWVYDATDRGWLRFGLWLDAWENWPHGSRYP